jgi:glycine/D-amino acid oxidase-like deaminating enzyme
VTGEPRPADLAVVGGGVIGSFVAHEALRQRPDWRVLLLERSTIGAGATAWSAGVSFPLAATPRHRDLVRGSAAGYAALRGTPAGHFLRPVPMVYVVSRQNQDALLARLVDAVPRPLTAAERARVTEILPDLSLGTDDELLTHDGHGFAVRARPLAETLTGDAAERAEVQLGQRVTAIDAVDDGYRLVTGHSGFTARRVVLASGPWATPTIRPVPLPPAPGSRRKRIAALHARLPVRLGDPLVYFVDDDLFILPLTAGAALVSFYREVWDTDPDVADGRPDAADLQAGTEALARRSASAAAAVTGGRAFCDLYTDHRVPVVTTDPALPGLAAVRGGSGSGVRLAPALAAEAVAAVR